MPYDIAFDGKLIRVAMLGLVTKEELFTFIAALAALEETLEPVPDRIVDLTRVVDRQADFDAVFAIGGVRERKAFPNSFRSAFVAPSPMSYGFARMFQTLNTNPQIDLQIFRTLAEAESWLAAPRGQGTSDGS